jgi:hypothetical protein
MYSFIPSPKVPVYILHLGNIVKSCFWGPSEDEGPQHYRCGKSSNFVAKCPYTSDSDRDDDKKEKKKMEKKRYYKKGGEAHMGREWDFDESSTDSSSDEDAANIAINKGLLFPNVGHKCLMAKDAKKKKVHSRDTPNILLPMMRLALVIMKMT